MAQSSLQPGWQIPPFPVLISRITFDSRRPPFILNH
jgi:hypothetical protein